MLRKVLQTDTDRGSLLLRLGLAIVIFPHGAQKLLGWFGGFGLEGSLDYFTGTLGIPLLFAWLAVLAEFFGPVALAAGLLTRVSACGIGMVMLVGALFGLLVENPTGAFLPSGFFMNWFGQRQGEGLEFHILAMILSGALVIRGGGAWSLDRWLAARIRSTRADAEMHAYAGSK